MCCTQLATTRRLTIQLIFSFFSAGVPCVCVHVSLSVCLSVCPAILSCVCVCLLVKISAKVFGDLTEMSSKVSSNDYF
jgi:hypothetical protein